VGDPGVGAAMTQSTLWNAEVDGSGRRWLGGWRCLVQCACVGRCRTSAGRYADVEKTSRWEGANRPALYRGTGGYSWAIVLWEKCER